MLNLSQKKLRNPNKKVLDFKQDSSYNIMSSSIVNTTWV